MIGPTDQQPVPGLQFHTAHGGSWLQHHASCCFCCYSSAMMDWSRCCWNWFVAIAMLRVHSALIIPACVVYWWSSIFCCMLAWPLSASVASFSCCVIVVASRYGEWVAAP